MIEETTPNLCPACNGSAYQIAPGLDWSHEDCEVCHGEGVITEPVTEQDVMLPIYNHRKEIVRYA